MAFLTANYSPPMDLNAFLRNLCEQFPGSRVLKDNRDDPTRPPTKEEAYTFQVDFVVVIDGKEMHGVVGAGLVQVVCKGAMPQESMDRLATFVENSGTLIPGELFVNAT